MKTTFKVGNRVPVATGGTSGGTLVNTQFTYIDVGLNIDCVVAEAGSKFAMHADLDISTAVMPDKNPSAVQNPTISQIRLNMDTTVAPGKPTIVASFDDPVTAQKVRYRRGDYENVRTLPYGRRMIRSSIAASTALRENGIGW